MITFKKIIDIKTDKRLLRKLSAAAEKPLPKVEQLHFAPINISKGNKNIDLAYLLPPIPKVNSDD